MRNTSSQGQEDNMKHTESEGRFTGFNMKDELTEGHFDKQGTFIFDKDNVCYITDQSIQSRVFINLISIE